MLKLEDRIFKNIHGELPVSLPTANKNGDFVDTASLLSLGREEIIERVKKSGLRGRGGAGFSTGAKWSFIPKEVLSNKRHYLVINADEGEPGTCKDREILRFEPFKLLEGILIASYAINAHSAYIYVRGEFSEAANILQKAIDDCYAAGLLGKDACNFGWDLDVYIHRGAGAYICGEESALIESIEGKKGQPRLKPPFPALVGLYGMPTVVNNVESIAVVPTILRRGAEWFSSIGRANNTGTKLFCISGHVNKPCVVEEAMGVSLQELINGHAGGVVGGWDNLQAVIPGGSSTPIINATVASNLILDYDGCKEAKTSFGTGAVIVMDKSVDLVKIISRLSKFYKHESCGQCTPCREGTGWLMRLMQKLEDKTATAEDLNTLNEVTKQIELNTICALGDAACWPIQSLISSFPKEVNACLVKPKN